MNFKPQYYPNAPALPEAEIAEAKTLVTVDGRIYNSITLIHVPTGENVVMAAGEDGDFQCEEDRKMLYRALAHRVGNRRKKG